MHRVLRLLTILVSPCCLCHTGEPKDDATLDVVLHELNRGAQIIASVDLLATHFLLEPGMWVATSVARALHLLST